MIKSYSEEDVDLLFNNGIESFNLGDVEEALSYFDKVLEIEPNHVKALNNKGVVLSTLEKHEEAISYFDKALQIDSKYADALANKGSALGSLGQFDDAILYLDQAIEIVPNHVNALNNKATVMVSQGNYYDAISYFHQVLTIDPDNELAKKWVPLAKDFLGYNIIEGFVEFLVRDSHGNLITYYKAPYLAVLNHEIADNYIDRAPVSHVITYQGKDYEVRQRLYTNVIVEDATYATVLVIDTNAADLRLIVAPAWGYPVKSGDVITTLYTIFREIE